MLKKLKLSLMMAAGRHSRLSLVEQLLPMILLIRDLELLDRADQLFHSELREQIQLGLVKSLS